MAAQKIVFGTLADEILESKFKSAVRTEHFPWAQPVSWPVLDLGARYYAEMEPTYTLLVQSRCHEVKRSQQSSACWPDVLPLSYRG